MARARKGHDVYLTLDARGWSAVLVDRKFRSINVIHGDGPSHTREDVERAAEKAWPEAYARYARHQRRKHGGKQPLRKMDR